MKIISNGEAFEYYCATSKFPQNTAKSYKASFCAKQFIEQKNLPDSDLQVAVRFKRLIETKPNHKESEENQLVWRNKEFMTLHKGGRPRKSLGENPCTKHARSILNEKALQLEQFALDENITKEDALDMLVSECKRKWKIKCVKKCYLPQIDATALIYNINLSIAQYQMLRYICLPFNIVFPVRNDIDALKNTLHPPIISQEIKSSVKKLKHLLI